MTSAQLHARLSGYYFFYYATVGAFMPYWSPYLEARGFTATEIGVAYAMAGLLRAVMPFLWGWWGDHTGQRIRLVRQTSVASLLLFLLIPFVDGVWAITAAMMGYNLFWQALLAQFETVSMVHLQATGGDYSRVRLWGSVGFVVAVLSLGPLLDIFGILPLPWLVGVLFAGMAASSYLVPETPHTRREQGLPLERIGPLLKRPEVIALLLACLCSQMSFAPYYNFFTLFLERNGHARSLAGVLWAIAVVAEIVLFIYMSRLIAAVGARRLLLTALAATVLRWLLTVLLVDSFVALVGIQLLHALTFGAYHACAMHYVFRLFPVALQGRGQAVYNAAAYGVGGSIGSLGAGAIWDHVRPEATFLIAALIALAGTWIVWRKVPDV